MSADSLGRVLELDLAGNGLAGVVSPELGDLGHMTVLKLGGNDLSGRLPQSLARLPLREFRYADTELCVSPAAAFRAWLDGIAEHEGTGAECAPLSDREVLVVLYEATDGPNWTNSENWLTDAPLAQWHGVRVDREGRVTRLRLPENGLAGRLPPEIGGLAKLDALYLPGNRLTGPIPPELGGLASLVTLELWGNAISGALPSELGGLASLWGLSVSGNRLTGPIPPELGNLSNLRYLRLGRDPVWPRIDAEKGRRPRGSPVTYPALTGSIPPDRAR